MSQAASPRGAPRAIQGWVGLGGVAALSWEVLWQHHASLALGVSALGTAITLAATMAGMTAGSLVAGRWLRRNPPLRPTRLYGSLEGLIGCAGLVMPAGFALLEGLDASLFHSAPALAPVIHALGIILLLGPATIAMGATVPLFELLGRAHGTSVARLYGINIAGASLGVLLLAFWAIGFLGVWRTGLAVAGVNFAVFAGTRLLAEPAGTRVQAQPPVRRPGRVLAIAHGLAFTTGFVTFGLEVAWFRSLRAAFQSVSDSFAIMLASVLIPLAIAARLAPWLRRREVQPATLLAVAGAAILLATPLVERIDLFAPSPSAHAGVPGGYLLLVLQWLGLSLALIGPPVLLLGLVLPWLLEDAADPHAAGRLYGVNTAGSVLGSLSAAWLLLPALGFARSAWLLGGATVLVACAATRGRLRLAAGLAGAAALGLAVLATSSIGRDRIQLGVDLGPYEILAYEEGPDVTVSAVAFPERGPNERALVIDGFVATAQALRFVTYMEWMGRLPMLLHPAPQRALVIAFGTGQTANAVREEGPVALDVVDVSQAVLDLAPHFSSNRGVLDDPRVQAIAMDGRAWLRRTEHRYDVVTLEPMPPNFAGVNALYSRDFYELIAERLEPGGVVAQWLPLHLVPPRHARSLTAAFRAVFPDSLLWLRPPEAGGVLVGRRAGSPIPIGSEWPGFAREVPTRSLPPEVVRAGVILDPGALARYSAGAPAVTDDNQLLAYGSVSALIRFYGNRLADENFARIRALRSSPGQPRNPAP